MKAPERIWAAPFGSQEVEWENPNNSEYFEYVTHSHLADLLEVYASAEKMTPEYLTQMIQYAIPSASESETSVVVGMIRRDLNPLPDGEAALDCLIAEAREEGRREGLEQADVSQESREDIVDTIEEIISETHDIDVTDRNYAENVVCWLERHHPDALRALARSDREGE